MADYLTTDTELTSVADAIRTKGGTSASLVYPTGFVTAIGNIDTAYPSADGVSFGTVPSTISFMIDSVTYQADPDMTWSQWVESAYCSLPLFYTDKYNCYRDSNTGNKVYYSGTWDKPQPNTVIYENDSYETK